jgi:pimeloyl-ACP methyl ester carboxylesterase
MSEWRITEVCANGIHFTAVEQGDGPLMLCLHGFPDNAHSFAHQFGPFAGAGYRVVAPFMRGYAPTGAAPNGQYHAACLGQDVIALIDALGGERAVVLGHDFGAVAAYAAALIAPEKVAAVIGSAVPYGPRLAQAMLTDPVQQRRSWYVFFFQTPLAELAVPYNDFAFIDHLWRDWSPGWQYPVAQIARVKKTLASPGVLEAALGYYRSPLRGAPDDPGAAALQARIGTEAITVPTLYVHGALDGCIGVDVSHGMEDLFTGRFRRETVDGAGHFVHQEAPDAFNRLVLTFLS